MLEVKRHKYLMDYYMVFLPYMPTTGGGGGRYTMLLIHRCNTKHTKSSACVMMDGKLPEDATGQICAQYGLMDHIDPGRSAPVRKEVTVVLVSLCLTQSFWFLVLLKIT